METLHAIEVGASQNSRRPASVRPDFKKKLETRAATACLPSVKGAPIMQGHAMAPMVIRSSSGPMTIRPNPR